MPAPSDAANLLPVVLGLYGLWQFGPGEPVAGGTLNWNFSVHTDSGHKFVRRYRDDITKDRIQGEHDLLTWLAERGVPVAAANETPGGATFVEVGQARWAVFDWVEGEVLPRGTLTPARARMLGAARGQAHPMAPTPLELPSYEAPDCPNATGSAFQPVVHSVALCRRCLCPGGVRPSH